MWGIYYCTQPECYWAMKKLEDKKSFHVCPGCGSPAKYVPIAAIEAWEKIPGKVETDGNTQKEPSPDLVIDGMISVAINTFMDNPAIRHQIARGACRVIRGIMR